MRNSPRILLALAGLLLAVQPALACGCLEDLPAPARVAGVEDASCHESVEAGPAGARDDESGQCADCGDYQPPPVSPAAKAMAANTLPEFKAPPAIADRAAVSVRPQRLRSIEPAPTVPRATPTPILLKQRLLI